MRSLYLLAAFLSAVCAQVVAGTFGNAVCEADYNSGIQALANCGYTISLDGSVAVTGARSTVSPCICKPDNVNAMSQIKTSCAAVKQVETVQALLNLHLTECAALAKGLPTTQPTGPSTTGVSTVVSLTCEAAGNNLIVTWNKCGVNAANVPIANQQDAVKCVCKNLNVVEDVMRSCAKSTAASSSQQSYLADIQTLCAAKSGDAKSGAASLRVPVVPAAFGFAASRKRMRLYGFAIQYSAKYTS